MVKKNNGGETAKAEAEPAPPAPPAPATGALEVPMFQFSISHECSLWLFNIAMENTPFIDGLPITNGDFPWLWILYDYGW